MEKKTEQSQKPGTRPQKGEYPTFTSMRGRTTLLFQKPVYGLDEFKSRKLISEKVTITIQGGSENSRLGPSYVEFDVYKECLGDTEGKNFSPYFHKLCTEGYLSNGKTVMLDPSTLQKFLEAKVKSDTNRVILWENRPRSDKEKQLEGVMKSKDTVIASQGESIEKMRILLHENKIHYED